MRTLVRSVLSASLFASALFAAGMDAANDRMKAGDLATEARIASGKMKDFPRARAAIVEAYKLAPNLPKVQALYADLAGPETAVAIDEEIFFVKEVPEIKIRLNLLTNTPSSGAAWIKKARLFIKQGENVRVTLEATSFNPPVFAWNGKNELGEVLPDGSYTLAAEIRGNLDFPLYAAENRVMLVSKKLEAMIAVKEKLFAAGKETVNIQTIYPDRSRVTAWELGLTSTSGKLVRKLTGTTLPASIAWDGKDAAGEVVPGGDVFTAKLKGKDKSGKDFESNPDQAESEIAIIDIGGGQLSFKMSTLQFDIGKADLKTNCYVLLDRVAAILKKYSWYSVKIQGHTDNVGGEAENKALSQKRAESVSAYLSAKDAKIKERVAAEGIGPGKPVADNATESGRAKNRRVEFILTKIPLKE
ncbi:MAG: OmpA family protein [Spirochaetes bacterium]|nr:OmpA family protein [Spirochaetota bacterium]